MSPIRYRRTSVRTALGITKEEKRIKRELGITALLKPFRWWGNEKRKLKRDVGYYSPEAKFARHFLPRSVIHFFTLVRCDRDDYFRNLGMEVRDNLGHTRQSRRYRSTGPTAIMLP